MCDWLVTENGLFRRLSFNSFSELTQFLAALGPFADEQEHHPDLKIHRAVLLDVTLITHDQGTITEKDHRLAAVIDQLCVGY